MWSTSGILTPRNGLILMSSGVRAAIVRTLRQHTAVFRLTTLLLSAVTLRARLTLCELCNQSSRDRWLNISDRSELVAQTDRASVSGVCQAGHPGFQPRSDYRLCISTLHLVLHQFTPFVCLFVLSTDRWIMGTGKEANKLATLFDK